MQPGFGYAQPMKGYMYILKCSDDSYYVGSTNNLELRLAQHQAGKGANHTKKHLPVELVYYEEYSRIDVAFYREKQVQGWSRKKKEALIANRPEDLHLLAACKNESHFSNRWFRLRSTTERIKTTDKTETTHKTETTDSETTKGIEITEENETTERSENIDSDLVIERSRNHHV